MDLVTVRKTCRLCGSEKLVRTLTLAQVPIVSPNVGAEADASGQPADASRRAA